MMGKQRIKSGLLAAGVLLSLGAVQVEGQSVEAILLAREELELTEQQLDQIRLEAVAQRNADMARRAELRSQLAAGQVRRSEVMALMEDQQEARQARTAERRATIESILSEEQLESVRQMRRRADRQRPGGRQGFAPRRRRDFGPGGRRGADLGGPSGLQDPAPKDDAVIGLR